MTTINLTPTLTPNLYFELQVVTNVTDLRWSQMTDHPVHYINSGIHFELFINFIYRQSKTFGCPLKIK